MSNASRRVAAVLLAVVSLGLSGCKAEVSASPTASPDISATMLQYERFSARLFGAMAFESSGTAVTLPTEFSVTAVPIEWMGLTFTGAASQADTGREVSEQVHGTVSDDGQWISSVSYSRRVFRQPAGDGTQFTITLRNLPVSQSMRFEKSGSEVQKYVVSIEYREGPLLKNQIVESTRYLSTDWKASQEGRTPTFDLALSKGQD